MRSRSLGRHRRTASALSALKEAGVTQFNIYLMNGDEEDQLDLYAPIIEREAVLERT